MGKKNPIWDNEILVRSAFEQCGTMRAILIFLDEPCGSANYAALKRAASRYDLQIPKRTYQELRNINRARRKSLDEITVAGSSYNRYALKKRLIANGTLIEKCSIGDCPTNQMDNWLGKKIPLHLDHINGVSDDHRIENLRLLCPICHALTDTFSGKNKFK